MGRVLGLGVLMVALAAGACSDDTDSPTDPSGIPPAAGTYTGTYRVKTCSETLTATTGQICGSIAGETAPQRQPLRLTLQQTEGQVVGNLEFSGWYARSLVVTGTVDRNGALVLTGATVSADPACPAVQSRLTLNNWLGTLTRASEGVRGEFGITATRRVGTTGCVFSDVTIEADTMELTRS